MDTPFFSLLLPASPREDAPRPAPARAAAGGSPGPAPRRSAFGQLALAFGPRLRLSKPAASAHEPQGGRPAA